MGKAILFNETIRNNILAVKTALNLTMAKIGDATGVSGATVSTIIHGKRIANPEWPDRFCEAYHVDKDWLYHGTGDPVFLSEATSLEKRDSSDACKRLKEFRKQLGLKQYMFSDRLGVSRQTYSNIELGQAKLTNRMAEKIENEFGIGSEWILYGDEGKKDHPVCSRMIDYLWNNESERERLWKLMTSKSE